MFSWWTTTRSFATTPEVIVLDVNLPTINGGELLEAIKHVSEGGLHFPAGMIDALLALVPESSLDLSGNAALTGRELEVLALLAEACSNKDIAAKLGFNFRTAEAYRENISHKLNHALSLRMITEAARVTPNISARGMRVLCCLLSFEFAKPRRTTRMKTTRLILLASSILISAFAAAQAPATPLTVSQQDKKDNASAQKDIDANATEITTDQAKINDSHVGEDKVIEANRVEEKAKLADATKDKALSKKAKKTKKAAIKKDMKAERKITSDQADADRKPLEKDVRLDKAAVKDDQKNLDAKEAAEMKEAADKK